MQQLKMKQKNAATPMPGAIIGTKWRKKKEGPEWPSIKAVSSNALGTARIKLSKIQIVIGRLNRQWASAMPKGEFTRPSFENRMKIGKDSTTGGVIRKTSIAKRKCRSPKNRNRANV